MNGTGAIPPNQASKTVVTPEEQRAQLEKVLRSEVFSTAPALQRFLEYVASKTIEGLSHEIKEFTIGSEVMERPAGYDPKIDTVVRVQAHRLREKLKEYYDAEGATDEILLVIPKGHYVPRFSRREAAVAHESESPQPLTPLLESPEAPKEAPADHPVPGPSLGTAAPARKRPFPWFRVGLAGVPLFLGLTLLLPRLRSNRTPQGPGPGQQDRASATEVESPVAALWADFLKNESSPIVAYSNDVFLATETADLLRIKGEEIDNMGAPASRDVASRLAVNPRLLERAGPVFFQDVYTGTGEVMAVFYLTRMFGQFHASLGVKRSRLVTTDDLARHDIIFLGSTKENALLAGLPLTQDFVFAWPPQLVGNWKGRILNLHPQPSENLSYEVERDLKTRVVRTDYALVSFLPGITPNRKIAVLAGLTTLGTQAAADFATSPAAIAELGARLGTGPPTSPRIIPPFFQAVLRVEIMRGDVLRVKYVTGHVIHATQRLSQKN